MVENRPLRQKIFIGFLSLFIAYIFGCELLATMAILYKVKTLDCFYLYFVPSLSLIIGYVYLFKWSDKKSGISRYAKLSIGSIFLSVATSLVISFVYFYVTTRIS